MFKFIKIFKKLPIDFNQYEMREKTKGKLIAFSLAGEVEGKSALDIGCRDGYWSRKLEEIGYEVTAVDIDSNYSKCQFADANKKLPFNDSTFDLIWSTEVLEHLENPSFSVSEMQRVLKPGGKILLTTPNSNVWLFRFLKTFVPIQKLQSEHHKQFFFIEDMKTLFPGGKIFGFFPYAVFKFKISRHGLIDWLSPVFVVYYDKN